MASEDAPPFKLSDTEGAIGRLRKLSIDTNTPAGARALYAKQLQRLEEEANTVKAMAEAHPPEAGPTNEVDVSRFTQPPQDVSHLMAPPQDVSRFMGAPKQTGFWDRVKQFAAVPPPPTPGQREAATTSAQKQIEEGQQQVLGSTVKAGRAFLGGRTFGLSERVLGATGLGEKISGLPDIGGPIEPVVEQLAGLGGSIKSVGNVAETIGRMAKYIPQSQWLLRLAQQVSSGKGVLPKLAAGVQFGLANGTATLLEKFLSPGGEKVTSGDVAKSAAAGFGIGAVTPGATGPLNLALRQAAIGIPIQWMTGGQTTTPFHITGRPMLDQFAFDYGLAYLMSPKGLRPGATVPIMTFAGGKPQAPMNGEILEASSGFQGQQALKVRLSNGMVRDYKPGQPLILDLPQTKSESEATSVAPRLKEGDLVVHTKGKQERLLQFNFVHQDGKHASFGVVTERGRTPIVHDVLNLRTDRLNVLHPDALDKIYPMNFENKPAEPPKETPDFVYTGEKTDTDEPVIIGAKAGDVRTLLDKLPPHIKQNVNTVVVRDLDVNGRWRPYVKTIELDQKLFGKGGRIIGNVELRRGLETVLSTVVHEASHSIDRPNQRYINSVKALGWAPYDEVMAANADNLIRVEKDPFPNDKEPDKWTERHKITNLDTGQSRHVIATHDYVTDFPYYREEDPKEATEGRLRHDRRNPTEDKAYAFQRFLSDPDGLFHDEPHRWQAIHDSFNGTPFSIPGFTREATGQTRLFPEPFEAPTGERLEAAKAASEAKGKMAAQSAAIESYFTRKGGAAPSEEAKPSLKDLHDSRFKEIMRIMETHPELTPVWEKASKIAEKEIERLSEKYDIKTSVTIGDTGISIYDALRDEAVHEALRAGSAKNVSVRIGSRMIDMARKGVGKEEALPTTLEGEELPLPTTQPATPTGKERRVRSNAISRLFKGLVGVEEKRPQLRAELSSLSPFQQNAVTMHLGIDLSGNLTGSGTPFAEVARSLNMEPDELGRFFRGLIRQRDGALKDIFKVRPRSDATRYDYSGQGVLPFINGTEFGRMYNASKAPTEAIIREELERAQNLLVRAPDNVNLQKRVTRLMGRLDDMQQHSESTASDPEPGSQPHLPLIKSPPPEKIAPWLRQIRDDRLVKKWHDAAVAFHKNPAGEGLDEARRQLASEMNRRGLQLPPLEFPQAAPGVSATPPPEPPPSEPPTTPPPPKQPPENSIHVQSFPDLTQFGQQAAVSKGDLNPKLFRITDASSNQVIGTFQSFNLRPDFTPNPRYHVEPFGYVNEAGEKQEAGKGQFRFTVTDLESGNKLGNYSRAGVKQLLGSAYIPFVNYDPRTGRAMPNATEVAASTKNTPLSKVGSLSLRADEFQKLPPEHKISHILQLATQKATSPDNAWRIFEKLNRFVENYPTKQDDFLTLHAAIYAKWGPPTTSNIVSGDVLDGMAKARKLRETWLKDHLAPYEDFWSTGIGGTEKAFSPRQDRQSFVELLNLLTDPNVPPPSSDLLQGTTEGRLAVLWPITPVVRQALFFGHPIMADFHIKSLGADNYHQKLTEAFSSDVTGPMSNLSKVEAIAVAREAEGRYQEGEKVDVAKRAFNSKDPSMAPVKYFLNRMAESLTGGPATESLFVPPLNEDLKHRAQQLRAVLDKWADMGALPREQRIEQYFPHLFPRGAGSYFNLPPDMNIGREVFFRFFQPRSSDLPGYEPDPREVLDVYGRGLARKIAFDPLVREFSQPEVMGAMDPHQQKYLKNLLKYIVGQPDESNALLARALERTGIETKPGAMTDWLRRLASDTTRPASHLAQAVRGWWFLNKIGFNVEIAAAHLPRAWITESMQYGFPKMLAAYKDAVTDEKINAAFQASGLPNQFRRADMGTYIGQTKGFLAHLHDWAGKPLETAVDFNKKVTFSAAYKAAGEAGLTAPERTIAGILESELTQMNLTRTGRMPYMRGNWGSTLFQFTPFRAEYIRLFGAEVLRTFKGAATSPEDFAKGLKRLTTGIVALHLVGGLDAHFGPLLRYLTGNTDPEWSGLLGAIDQVSLDWALGNFTQGKPFEWGHRINPITMLNRVLWGPMINTTQDFIAKYTGKPGSPTSAQIMMRDFIPFGTAAERLAGPELEKYVTKPIFGEKEGKLSGGSSVGERLFGKEPRKGTKQRG